MQGVGVVVLGHCCQAYMNCNPTLDSASLDVSSHDPPYLASPSLWRHPDYDYGNDLSPAQGVGVVRVSKPLTAHEAGELAVGGAS